MEPAPAEQAETEPSAPASPQKRQATVSFAIVPALLGFGIVATLVWAFVLGGLAMRALWWLMGGG